MNYTEDRYADMFKSLGVIMPEGFFFSPKFNHFQKRNNRIYVYVTPEAFQRWKVQAYVTGTAAMCSLEARINWEANNEVTHNLTNSELVHRYGKNIQKIFNLAELWLDKYSDSPEGMDDDPYSPWAQGGWEGEDLTKKEIQYKQ